MIRLSKTSITALYIGKNLRTGLAFTRSRRHWLAEEEIPTEMDTITKFPVMAKMCQFVRMQEK